MSVYAKTAKYKEIVLEDIRNNQGTKMNSIAVRCNIGDYSARNVISILLEEKKVIKQGSGSQIRYYTADYDRTTHTPYDNVPIVNKVANRTTKPEYAPSPKSILAIPDPKQIPDNIFNVELTAESAGIEEEPIEEPVEVPKVPEVPPVNYDRIMEAIKVFSEWTDIGGVSAIVEGLKEKMNGAVLPCRICGKSRLMKDATGEYRITCECGFMFANIKSPKSLGDTIEAYNKWVTA